ERGTVVDYVHEPALAVAELDLGIAAVPLQPGPTGGQAAVTGHLYRQGPVRHLLVFTVVGHCLLRRAGFFNGRAVTTDPVLTPMACCRPRLQPTDPRAATP